ncbi:MAG: tetratricopeptide repeat protein [Gemmatimonadetes bacterium]|nr:tetratricopeptide repeat protein [Gemmatimonadota bacterium]
MAKTGTKPSLVALLAATAAGCGGAGRAPAYVGGQVCAECHTAEADRWAGSHHDLAMQAATDSTVLGDFSGVSFTHGGDASSFFRQDGAFFVRTRGPDGSIQAFQITHTFGVTPLQQYLIELPGGRYQMLGVAWDSRLPAEGGQRWFHLYPDDSLTVGDRLHWTGPDQNWNYMCAACHSTNLAKRYDLQRDAYATTWAEIDVSCEACHGPGSRHVSWATGGATATDAPVAAGLTVDLASSSDGTWTFGDGATVAHRTTPRASRAQSETCAACHSRRREIDDDYQPGDHFLDGFVPSLLTEGLYHADGQIQDEVFVYGSFRQSKMYASGVTCSDCHDPHSARVYDSSNGLCAQCHRATIYDSPAHHFHEAGSAGARCVECHMPETTYMVIDPRRDHGIRVPRPDLSVALGTPNACTQCHVDRSPAWAEQAVTRWYGPDRPPHYGEALHLGRLGVPTADVALAALVADSATPKIVKASAIELLGNYGGGRSLQAIDEALGDVDPLVRMAAARASAVMEPSDRYQAVFALLRDSLRAVRDEAALVLAAVPVSIMPGRQQAILDSAILGYIASQLANAERPESHLNIAHIQMARQRFQEAEAALGTAMRLDSSFVPALVNLAELRRLQGRDPEGEALLDRALAIDPQAGAVHHARGLLLVRLQRHDEALGALLRAAQLSPDQARFAYVYAIALHSTGRVAEAVTALEAATANHPYELDLLAALVSINRESGDYDSAIPYAERLVELLPDDLQVQSLLDQLRSLGNR